MYYYGFALKDGAYNSDYLPHLQILGSATDTAEVPVGILKTDVFDRLADKFQSAIGNRQPSHFAKLLTALRAHGDKLWTAHAMGGAEYERGGFLAYAASRISQSSMIARTISVDVDFETLPSRDAQRYMNAKSITSVRKQMAQDGVTLPERVTVDVHIIAPRDKMNTVIDMMRHTAAARSEPVTHRGFGFVRAIAEMVSGRKPAEAGKNTSGWFEIHQGAFIFIDRMQFVRMANALDITLPAAAPKTAPQNRSAGM